MAISKVIGALNVDITARTKKFHDELEKARKEMASFAGAAKKIGGALVAVFASSQVFNGLRRMTQQMDDLATAAQRLNVSLTEMQALNFTAGQAGTNAGTVAKAMQRMERRIGEAALGRGEALKTLETLGLNPASLVKMGPIDMLEAIGAELNKVENSTIQLAHAFKIWDSEGVDMLRVTRDLGKSIEEMRYEMDRLGITLEDTTVNTMNAAERDFKKLGAMWDSFWTRTGAETYRMIKAIQWGLSLPSRTVESFVGTAQFTPTPSPSNFQNARTVSGMGIEERAQAGRAVRSGIAGFATVGRRAQTEAWNIEGRAAMNRWVSGMPSLIRSMGRGAQERFRNQAIADSQNKWAEKYRARLNSQSISRGFSFAESGSAAAFRQQAAIRRQNEQQKLDKERNNFLQEIAESLRDRIVTAAANFQG